METDQGWREVIRKKNPADRGKDVHTASRPVGKQDARKVLERRLQRPKIPMKINVNADKKSWLEICTNRRKISNAFEMDFIPLGVNREGTAFAQVSDEMLAEGAEMSHPASLKWRRDVRRSAQTWSCEATRLISVNKDKCRSL